MGIVTVRDSKLFSMKEDKIGQYDTGRISTSKFSSSAYYYSDKAFETMRGAVSMSKPSDSKEIFKRELKKSIDHYIGNKDYKEIGNIVLVKKSIFKDLISIKEAVEKEIDSSVEEIALERMNDELEYDLSSVMEMLQFDESDLAEIKQLLEDEDF